jgi:hypothetical protein
VSSETNFDDKNSDGQETSPGTTFSKVVFYSLLAGATALIPIPFLDDRVYKGVKRRMVQDIFWVERWNLRSWEVWKLADPSHDGRSMGCLARGLFGLIVWPAKLLIFGLRKLIAKIIILWLIKDATDQASRTFHEGYLLSRAALRIRPENRSINELRAALDETLAGLNTSPVHHVFSGAVRWNRKVFREAARVLWEGARRMRRTSDRDEETERVLSQEKQLLGELLGDTSSKLLGQKGYLRSLELRFEKAARQRDLL